jgi:MFS family permease
MAFFISLLIYFMSLVFDYFHRDGLAPFVSVYLVAFAGISAGDAGLIWFAKDIAQMVSQLPIGVLVDKTTHKKAFLVFFTLLTTLLPMIIIFTQRFSLLIAKSILEGIGATGLMAFKGPFTLGIAGHENFEEAAKYTEMSEHLGSLVVCSAAGILGYFTYPNVLSIFYVIGVFGSVSTLCLLSMVPKEKHPNIIDDDVARNSSGKSESIWNIFVSNKAMSFFALSVFFFHLSNAAILPLLGQILALEEGRNGIPYTSSLIVIAQITSMGGIYMLDYFTNTLGRTINVPIMIGFGALIARICCILVLLNHFRNPYALLATQVFDGLGVGVNGLAILRVTKTLTENTNRFGLVFSIVNMCWAFGGALSMLVAGYLVDLTRYEIALASLLAPGVLCLIFLSVTKVQAPTGKDVDVKV